jgi:hypothetical protein
MTKKELEAASFSNLIRAIDKKWGHTYEDVKEEDLVLSAAEKAGWDDNYKTLIIEELPLNNKV